MHLRHKKLLLSTAMLAGALTGYARRSYAQCAPAGGSTFQCAGANTTTQTINANDAAVSTQPGFSVDTTLSGGHAITITGDGALSYTDTNSSALTSNASALDITANGDNGATPGSITIQTNGALTGGNYGIYALSQGGSGALTITANGDVTSTGGTGIYARNSDGTDLTVTTGPGTTVTGSSFGIFTRVFGSGALTITANGNVTGTNYSGIYAYNSAYGTSLTVTTGPGTTVTGNTGIFARSYGTGALTVTANGNVTGTNYSGIYALNAGTDLIVTTAAGTTVSSSGLSAIEARNNGSGALTITANGDVTSSAVHGISARNSGTSLTVTTGPGTTVTGDNTGIRAENEGSGALTITANGNVTGTANYGIYAYNSAASTNLTVTTAAGTTVMGGSHGIYTRSYSGTLTITADGDVTGAGGDGIYAIHFGAGPIAITVGALSTVNGGNYGIRVLDGAANVIVAGTVNGGAGGAISFDQGAALADRLELRPGAVINGLVLAGPGSDTLAFGGAGNGSFNLAAIDTGALTQQYQSFETFQVESGTWTFSGATTTAFAVNGGTLSGSATFGALTVNSGGAATPGSATGTLNVTNDVTFNAGSFYQVQVNDAGQSGLINAGGQAVINGGTVQVLAQAGAYALQTQYTIVTGAGGVVGTFSAVTSNFAFLSPSLLYDANNVFLVLDLINAPDFVGFAGTPNQAATAGALQNLGAGNPVFDALLLLPNDPGVLQGAFDSLSGELHASAKAALLQDSWFVRDAVNGRLRGAFGQTGAPSMPVMAYAPGGPELAPANTERFAVWGHAYGAWGQFDGDGNAAKLDRSTGGFFVGGDALVEGAFARPWRLGLAGGYGRSSFKVNDRSSSAQVDTVTIAGFGGTEIGALALRFGAAYHWHDIDTSRSIAFPGFASTAKASYDAGTAQVFGEAGYTIDTRFASFEPFANLAHVHLRTDGFSESGTAGLVAPGQNSDVTYSTLGLRVAAPLQLGTMPATLRGTLGWQHAFGDVTPIAGHAFAGGAPFEVAGTPIGRDTALLEAGFDVAVSRNGTLSLSYSGQLASDAQQHRFNARLGARF